MKRICLFIIIILEFTNSYAETCKSVPRTQQYNNSDLIVIGEVKKTQNNEFYIQIHELFKGKWKFSNLLPITKNTNSVELSLNEKWLLFLKKNTDSKFIVTKCSGSKNFNHFSIDIPPPPPQPSSMSRLNDWQSSLLVLEYKQKALHDLYDELNYLRNRKLTNDFQQLILKNRDEHLFYRVLPIGLLVLLIILVLILITRQRNNNLK